jgi:purine-binding chemotaxis protein CheW
MHTTKENVTREVLAFRLGEEKYGIDILAVQEICGCESVTRIANSPDFIKGVMNLRGVIVPIVDMRIKLNLTSATYNATTVVIVLNLRKQTVGMVVDSVSDVTNFTPDHVRPAPDMGSSLGTDYITRLGTLHDRMLILTDVVELMSSVELLGQERLAA